MDPTLTILLVVLVLTIVAGPALGFWIARKRLHARDQHRVAYRGAGDPSPPRMVGAHGMDPRLYEARPAVAGPATAPGAGAPPPLRFPGEPPAFGAPPAPPARVREPVETARGDDTAGADAAPTEPVPQVKAPAAIERPAFRRVADIVGEESDRAPTWVDRIPAGRLMALHRLGYDDPVKIANLRPSEVSRLARALKVPEDLITRDWMPAARHELGMRNPTA